MEGLYTRSVRVPQFSASKESDVVRSGRERQKRVSRVVTRPLRRDACLWWAGEYIVPSASLAL